VLSLMLLPAVCSRCSCRLLVRGPAIAERSLLVSSDPRLPLLPSSTAAAGPGCCKHK
jgi:hypothetical protein